MRRALTLTFLAALASSQISAAALPQLFAKAKEQFRLGSYEAALATLGELDLESSKPELETDRSALLPGLAFYRGACNAALGRAEEAKPDFELFLAYQPNASLDPGLYPKNVVSAFEETRRALEKKRESPEEPVSSLEEAYRAFQFAMKPEEESLGEDWVDGPARYLLTREERREFEGLRDTASRSEFVTNFWKVRDPRPETDANELREELEKRVAFADSRFTQDETRGALTDRGMVFILLGPPTYVGRKPLTTGEDANDPVGLKRFRMSDVRVAALPGGTTTQRAARIDAVTGPGTRINEAAANWREVWHYRRQHLPKEVPYLQVDFDFVTKQGYGKNVLQRETQILDTLERAKTRLRQIRT